ncbi:MAG: YbhB/YbcL family Raf kinase inhibitor-like protein [Gammaproteobacteria bacterium]|nr:YbhB/YbcL family Raf kinase inhibitor-like protein [Gammaproteobacteria bacterium]
MQLSSSVFSHQQSIPSKYTCDGENISPPLKWSEVPHGTQSFVLICDDPDASMKTWVHWVIFNIPPTTSSFPEDMQQLPRDAISGINSWNRGGYGGPCPPSGTHRYFFKLYALDTTLPNNPMTSAALEKSMKGHILAQVELIGLYQRK